MLFQEVISAIIGESAFLNNVSPTVRAQAASGGLPKKLAKPLPAFDELYGKEFYGSTASEHVGSHMPRLQRLVA